MTNPNLDLLNQKQQNRYNKFQGILSSGGTLGKKQQNKFNNLQGVASGKVQMTKDKFKGLTGSQNKLINQRQGSDIALGNFANTLTPDIYSNFSQDFDWNALPTSPVSGDFNDWRQQQIDQTYGDYTKRLDLQFKQEMNDFEQQMANRGIPMGSELYNQQKGLLQQRQSDARNSALTQAEQIAGQNASQFFNVGTTAQQNAYNMALNKKNMPLADYNALMASQSGMGTQNLGYSQNMTLQQQQLDAQKAMQAAQLAASMKMAGMNQGLGGYNGTGMSYQDYLNTTNQSNLNYAQQMQNMQPSGPSYGAQIGGGILGVGAGILGSYLGSQF